MKSLAVVNSHALALPEDGENDFLHQFIKPAEDTWLAGMVKEHGDKVKQIELIDQIVASGKMGAMNYYLQSRTMPEAQRDLSPGHIFNKDGAIAALNAEYWKMAFDKTDIYAHLPQKRRDEWNDMFREHKTVDFTEESVRATISDNLSRRAQYLSERVDGIFQNLSRQHVTNQPEGFSKRFILNYMFSYGDMPDHSRSGYISDLRHVVAMLTGREINGYIDSYDTLKRLYKRHGEWFDIDGGAFRMKAFLKGTVHIEINPEIAWKLNQLLAILYPVAIPSKFRVKPKKEKVLKEFNLRNDLLSNPAINALKSIFIDNAGRSVDLKMYRDDEKTVRKEVEHVMISIGGAPVKATRENRFDFVFDYDVRDVINEIVIGGYIPDYQSYQYYPTIPAIAKMAVDMAEITDEDECCEPSAGTGGIARFMPEKRTTCVEISNIHCAVLASKGFNVEEADFIDWAKKTKKRFDKIIMNPPFSEGRAQAHLEAAARILKPTGTVIAILPASFKGKQLLDCFDHHYTGTFENCFMNTGANVVVLKAKRRVA